MTCPDYLPAPIDGLDDLDHLIYDLKWRKHQPLREIADQVGMSHAGVRYRIKRMMPWLRPEDHDQLRDEEGVRLDVLRDQNTKVAERAIETDQLDLALKALREIHALTRTTLALYGLERRPDDRAAATPDRINELLGAYVQGVTDGAQRAPAAP